MLEKLQKVSGLLRPLTPLAVLLGLAGLGLFAWSAVTSDGDGYLIPGLLAALWGAWLFTLITGFRSVPPPAGGQERFAARFRTRLARAGYGLLAWIVVGAGLAALFMTYRLLTLQYSP